jgi:hypothetical protein
VTDNGDRGKARYNLETLLCNAASDFEFRQAFREHIVLNERRQQFQLVVGNYIANANLVRYMHPNRAADGRLRATTRTRYKQLFATGSS